MTAETRELDGKVVLVTGGGAGIGRAICLACADAGAHVVVVALGANGQETAHLADALTPALAVTADVTVAADIQHAVDAAVERFGKLDAIVHNATSRHSSGVEAITDISDETWDDHVAVSLRGAYHCAAAGLEQLRRTAGRFIVMTSPAGIEGSAARPAYSAVKGAVRGLVKSLALEWGKYGVNVVAVSPLAMTRAMEQAYIADPGLEEKLNRLVPLGRMGDPEADIAPVVRFLLTDGARYMTGQTIIVDGGRFTAL
jgi:NAD(P)-dependent dehydrogenase (short-subunit alcohol dehydrogenase family)